MFKWFTMLVTAASLCLFSSPIQCSLPVQSHDGVLKKTAKAPGVADPSGPLKERPEVQVDDDMQTAPAAFRTITTASSTKSAA